MQGVMEVVPAVFAWPLPAQPWAGCVAPPPLIPTPSGSSGLLDFPTQGLIPSNHVGNFSKHMTFCLKSHTDE